MSTSRRKFLKEVVAVSVLSTLPKIGFSKSLKDFSKNFNAVLHVGGLNAKVLGLSSSLEGLLLAERPFDKQDLYSIEISDPSLEMIVLKRNPDSFRAEISEKEDFLPDNIWELNPIYVDQNDLLESNYAIRKIGGLKTGIVGVRLFSDDPELKLKADLIHHFALQLTVKWSCQQVFCMVQVDSETNEKTLVQQFAQLCSVVKQVFCTVNLKDNKPSVLTSLGNDTGNITLLNLNQRDRSDIAQIGLNKGLIESFDTIEL